MIFTWNDLFVIQEEKHRNAPFVEAVGGEVQEEEQMMERTAEEARLGVNLILWAESRYKLSLQSLHQGLGSKVQNFN